MKVYAPPAGIKVPDFDDYFDNGRYSMDLEEKVNEAFFSDLENALRSTGYNGKLTGKLFYQGWADGAAQYMVAQKGQSICLIHLAIGDAWRLSDAYERSLTAAQVRAFVTAPKLFGEKR